MAIERESTRLFREARRARRLLGDRAGEAAAAQLGEYASKVAATEPAGIGSRDERMARQTLRRQSAALASGFRPNGAAATGDALAARQDLFKRMQAAGPQGAAQFRSEAASLGVSDVGFDRALRSVGGAGGTAATTTTAATPAPTTAPAPTASNQDNIPLFLRRTQEKSVTTSAAPVSMINGKPASEVLGPREDKDLTKADILRRAREESATNPSVTRQDVIDRLNAERRDKGMVDVNITGKELAAADIEQQTNVEAASSLQGQKFFNTMSDIEASLKPKVVATSPNVTPTEKAIKDANEVFGVKAPVPQGQVERGIPVVSEATKQQRRDKQLQDYRKSVEGKFYRDPSKDIRTYNERMLGDFVSGKDIAKATGNVAGVVSNEAIEGTIAAIDSSNKAASSIVDYFKRVNRPASTLGAGKDDWKKSDAEWAAEKLRREQQRAQNR